MTVDDVLCDARLWLGTMYVEQASLRQVGADCLGLIAGIPRDRGTPEGIAWADDQEFKGYSSTPDARKLLAGTAKYLDPRPLHLIGLADILMMRFEDDPQHFAIISRVDPFYIIHASNRRGRVVEHRLDDKWRSRVMRAYRYRGLE